MSEVNESRAPENIAATDELTIMERKLRENGHTMLADKIVTLSSAIAAFTVEDEETIESIKLEGND